MNFPLDRKSSQVYVEMRKNGIELVEQVAKAEKCFQIFSTYS